jgi:hypothetical protein
MRGSKKMHFIPQPRKITALEGRFSLSQSSRIVLGTSCDMADLKTARLIREEIKGITGFILPVTKALHYRSGDVFLANNGDFDESYTLSVSTNGIEIIGGGTGLFYGAQTLRQLLRTEGLRIPCLHIEDRPYFRHRGFFHDISRGKVPTLDTLKELADRSVFYKLNQLQLYVEHTFAFRHISEVWAGADPLTAAEILCFDEYCRQRHIELVPSLSTFGHLYAILSSESYHHLCELENSNKHPYSAINRMHHHTLDVSNPGSIALIEEMIGEYAPLFSSKIFNINCDETFDLGKGKSGDLVREAGRGRIYLDFLLKIADIGKRHGKRVMFWGDIILEHPEFLKDIPRDLIALNWNYNPQPDESRVKSIADSGLAQYVCPGVWGWRRIMNDFDASFKNIRRMIGFGVKYGACGVLNTDWGDLGHVNLFANSTPGIIYGANLSWNPHDIRRDAEIEESISYIEYGYDELMRLLKELGRQQPVRWEHVVFWDEKELIKDAEIGGPPPSIQDCDEVELQSAYTKALETEGQLFFLSQYIRNLRKADIREFCCAARGVALLNAFALAVKRYQYKQDCVSLVMGPVELAEALDHWIIRFATLWRTRNKESELYRIREVIGRMCVFLRKIGGKKE